MRRSRTGLAAAVAGIAALAFCVHGSASGGASTEPWNALRTSSFGAAVTQGTTPTPAAAKKPTRLQRIVRGLVAARAPGALAFMRMPKAVRSAAAGFASLQPRVQMRAADRYRVASVTKTFVATVVLQLAGEGKLSLDDPVERWLPGTVPNGGAITLRELLNHTSGLFDYTNNPDAVSAALANPGREWAPRELLAYAFARPPLFAPGANWSYSNTNYVLLGLVIEAVTGKKVEQVLRDRLFEPLRLRSTSFPSGTAVEEPFAHGYLNQAGTLVDLAPILNPSWAWAAGQIVSTAADLTKFFSALLNGRLLSPALLAQMKSGSVVGGTYGLGLRITFTRCGRAFGHDGDFIGWRNVVWSSANGRRVAVVMVNVDARRLSWARLAAAATSAFCSG